MTDAELDSLIRDAMDSGITHGLIPPETADLMRIRLANLIDPVVVTDRMADAFIGAEYQARDQPWTDPWAFTLEDRRRVVKAGLGAALKTRGYILAREP